METFIDFQPTNPQNSFNSCYTGSSSSVFQTVTLTVACIGIPLNLMAIVAVYILIKKDHVAPIYVINLLISDFIQFCCMIIRGGIGKSKICDAVLYIFETGVMVSICFMLVISLERYLVIVWPLWYKFRRNIQTSLMVCVVVWVFSLSYLPFYFFYPENAENIVAYFLILPLPLLCFFLIGTVKALSAARSVSSNEKRRVLAVLVTVMMSYSLLFVPRIIYLLTEKLRDTSEVVMCLPHYFSPLADLILYVFIRKGLADKVLVVLCCCDIDRDDVRTSKEKGEKMHTDSSLELQKEEGNEDDKVSLY